MSGSLYLDWAALAISLFNALVLFWLGLTVLLNAENRTWGILLAGEGLLTGAVFFIVHTVILSQGANALIQGLNFWWRFGWAPVIVSPYAWYILMLWYCGFWDDPSSHLRQRQRFWLAFSLAFVALLVVLLLVANPLPDLSADQAYEGLRAPALGNIPLIVLIYPFFALYCIGWSLEALLRPAPAARVLGDLARRRARPWLIATSLVLLLVSLLIGAAMLWLVASTARYPTLAELIRFRAQALSWFDLVLAGVLVVAVWLLGQAIISYEIFTGKTLPRRGLLNEWRNTLMLAAGFSILGSWGIVFRIDLIYSLLAALLLATFFYALFGWRSHLERDQNMRKLRPFVTSQRLLERMLNPAQLPEEYDLNASFQALCQEVLGARQAMLVPQGPLAALGVKPLCHPPDAFIELPALAKLLTRFDSPQKIGIPLDAAEWQGAAWALPLWSERGLSGILLLGEKSDGSFYSQEEIEIARASGERLADIQASTETARRLVALQRQRLAESQVLDRQARRVIHDDILPRLHTALLQLSIEPPAEASERGEALTQLTEVHRQISNLLHDLPAATHAATAQAGLLPALRQVTDVELAGAFDQVAWQVDPHAERAAQTLPPLTAEVVFYAGREAIRNAAYHARPAPAAYPLNLEIKLVWEDQLVIIIQDNGKGLSTADTAAHGSGQGLALHSTLLAVLGGSLALESLPDEFTRVVLRVPNGTTWIQA